MSDEPKSPRPFQVAGLAAFNFLASGYYAFAEVSCPGERGCLIAKKFGDSLSVGYHWFYSASFATVAVLLLIWTVLIHRTKNPTHGVRPAIGIIFVLLSLSTFLAAFWLLGAFRT